MLAIEAEIVVGACDKEARDREKTKDAKAAICCRAVLKPQLLSNQVRQTQA
jgi:hypothetical protein